MKWSLLELRKYQETPLTFHETLDLKAALMKRDNLILDVAPVEVEGLVSVDKKGYIVHLHCADDFDNSFNTFTRTC